MLSLPIGALDWPDRAKEARWAVHRSGRQRNHGCSLLNSTCGWQ